MSAVYKRKWRVFCWNVRGLNSDNRQREVRSKIEESECDVIFLQETKCGSFDWKLIRQFFLFTICGSLWGYNCHLEFPCILWPVGEVCKVWGASEIYICT
jgi:hypothetical protein